MISSSIQTIKNTDHTNSHSAVHKMLVYCPKITLQRWVFGPLSNTLPACMALVQLFKEVDSSRRCCICNRSWQLSYIGFCSCWLLLTTDSLSHFWFWNGYLIYSDLISCHFGLLKEGEKLLNLLSSLGNNSLQQPPGLCKAKGDALSSHAPVPYLLWAPPSCMRP